MRLAIDGGAFQQAIAAGIFNVAVGLMNALLRARPDISFVLVADPRLGPVREELLGRLSSRPMVMEAEVGPAYGALSRLVTSDPSIRFEVDGRIVAATISDGLAVYRGSPPGRSFRILSRADTPAATLNSQDTRRLGVAIGDMTVASGAALRVVPVDHPALTGGFHSLEGRYRWTNGAATLPIDLIASDLDEIELSVPIDATMTYRLGEGTLDHSFSAAATGLGRLVTKMEALDLEQKLIDRGVSAFFVNHFIPIRFARLPTYAILYDLIPVLMPEFFMEDARENFKCNIDVFKHAEHVFSISDASRTDLIRVLQVDADRATAMGIDIDSAFEPKSADAVQAVQRRYGLSQRPYALTVGTLEPRKNHGRLIEAYGSLARDGQAPYDLAIVGKPGWGTDSLVRQVTGMGLDARVHFRSDVPNEDLPALYSGALLSCYPSLYEGFGLPVLEAMACGCPVVTSDRSSMPEIAGDAAILVDPTSVPAIARGLHRVASSPALRARLAEAGLRQRRAFDWNVSAARVLQVLERR